MLRIQRDANEAVTKDEWMNYHHSTTPAQYDYLDRTHMCIPQGDILDL